MSGSGADAAPADDADAAPADDGEAPDAGGREATKADVADRERGERVYEETYGRSAGDRFGGADYPHAYGTPGAVDWRRALRAYVDGHDRGWEADRKYAAASGAGAEGPTAGREGEPERHEAPATPAGSAGAATARTERGTRFGVGVPDPDEMTFHRSASTWRKRLPEAPRMPRHAGRELDGRRGRGDQA